MLKKKIVITLVEDLVGHPTQLICIWIFICQQTEAKYVAGQSAIEDLEI